jgi:hypothetical protein
VRHTYTKASKGRKQFVIKSVERVREGTYKFFVDAGRDGEFRIIVYPGSLPMQVFGPGEGQWLERDIDENNLDKLRKEVKKLEGL